MQCSLSGGFGLLVKQVTVQSGDAQRGGAPYTPLLYSELPFTLEDAGTPGTASSHST